MFEITPPRRDETAAIEDLLDRAFGPDRLAKTSYRYRHDRSPIAALSFVAREADRIIGSIAFWPVLIGAAPALLLGPLAVDPTRKNEGIGKALVDHSLDVAKGLGHRLVILVGDAAYYARFGFSPAAPHGITMPDERQERLQVRELAPGALVGAHGDVRPAPETGAPFTARPDASPEDRGSPRAA